jgi:hypothetical protein
MRNRESLGISIKEFLSLPPADTARFHSGNSLEFLFCRFLTATAELSPDKIEQNAKLFELALRSELAFCDLKDQDTANFFAKVLPYTIAMTSKGEERDALMCVLVDMVPSLATQIDLARIDFVLSGTITDMLMAASAQTKGLLLKHTSPLNAGPAKDEGLSLQFEEEAQVSQDFETNTRLEKAYIKDLESNGTFSNFLALCADELALPVCHDERYLEAVAKFIESTTTDYPPPSKLLDFVIDQVADSRHFFDSRLNSCQFTKLRHLYLQSLISDLIKSDNPDCNRDPDIELLLGLEDLSNDDLIWINSACQADVHSYLPPPSSNNLLSLAAAHKIFLADKAQWYPNGLESLFSEILPEPLFHQAFNDLLPGQLLEQLGISSPDNIRLFCIAWGSQSFGALVRALDFSWYTGGISNLNCNLNKFKNELLELAFEQAMQTDDNHGPADLTLEFLTQKARARPRAEWLANGIREIFSNNNLVPGELGFNCSDQLELLSEIQRKFEAAAKFIDHSSNDSPQQTGSASSELLELLSDSLRQRGLDIAPDELQWWLKQTLVDSLGDWRRKRDRQGEGLTALPIAKVFVGLEEFTLSEWDKASILGSYFSLATPSSWLKDEPDEWIPDLIGKYCSDLREVLPNIGTFKTVNKLTALVSAHPYGDHPSGPYDRFAHIKLRELASSFGAKVGSAESIEAAKIAIRFCFLRLCDDLHGRKNSLISYETAAFELVSKLSRIEQLNGEQISTMDLFEDTNLFQGLKSAAGILLPSRARPDLVIISFMTTCRSAFRILHAK